MEIPKTKQSKTEQNKKQPSEVFFVLRSNALYPYASFA